MTWPLTGPIGLLNVLWQPLVHTSALEPTVSAAPTALWALGALLWLAIAALVVWLSAGRRRRD